ncbi:MAG: hypothetical protein CMH44_05955 [Muricauda sp.]|nr:hypothetical protein [Allomuricauda sp.]
MKKVLDSDDNGRILVYDEQEIGKGKFYRGCLGKTHGNRLICSSGNTLREDLALMALPQTKVIFGPCSGLLHCASAIWNSENVISKSNHGTPEILVYTGLYGKQNYNINVWWGGAGNVEVLYVVEKEGKIRIRTLHELPDERRNIIPRLGCEHYNAELLFPYFDGLRS